MKKILLSVAAAICFHALGAQPSQTLYTVKVAPDRADWSYRTGEKARFTISVVRDKVPVAGASLDYEYGPEGLPAVKSGAVETDSRGVAVIDVPGMKVPGFQTLRATFVKDGRRYSDYTNVGYDIDRIEPTQTLPADFREFWDGALAEVADVPLESLITLQPELCTPTVNVYHVRFNNTARGNYIYGMLCVPSAPGKYPAVLQVPGSGLHRFTGYTSLAQRGVITLEIGIHGIPVNLPAHVYPSLASAGLSGYAYFNMDDRDKYYYKRVYLGCKRAVDFLYSLDEFDGENAAVMGGSQGGQLAIVTAGLDGRLKCFASRHPGACDMTGALHGRPGGSPGLRPDMTALEEKTATSRYYDVVNFCRTMTVPGYFTWGLNDPACRPTTTFSAYNSMAAPKELDLYRETAHWHFPEQNARFENWVLERLGVE